MFASFWSSLHFSLLSLVRKHAVKTLLYLVSLFRPGFVSCYPQITTFVAACFAFFPNRAGRDEARDFPFLCVAYVFAFCMRLTFSYNSLGFFLQLRLEIAKKAQLPFLLIR